MRLDDNLYLNILLLLIVLLANGECNYPEAVEVRQDQGSNITYLDSQQHWGFGIVYSTIFQHING